jgi:PAS domain S-box-containing protein
MAQPSQLNAEIAPIQLPGQAKLKVNSESGWILGSAVVGGILSLVLFGITRSQIQARILLEQTLADLRQSEQALRESEERFRTFMAHNPASAWITDANGCIVYVNDTYNRMFGLVNDVVGQQVHQVYEAEIADQFLANIQTVANENRVIEFIEPAPRSDGTMGEFLVYKFPIRLEREKMLVGGVAIDITESRQAEELIRRNEIRFRMLIEQSPMSIQILAADGKTVQVNQAWKDLWNLKLDDLSHYNILEDQQLVRSGIMPYIQRAFAGEAAAIPSSQYDVNQTFPDRPIQSGVQRWVQAHIYPIKDESGHIREVVLMHEDITGKKHAEDALLAANKRIFAILESITDAFVALDCNWRYSYVNDAAEHLLQRSREELLGKHVWNDIYPERKGNVFYQKFQEAIEQQTSVAFEGYSDEFQRWLEIRAYPSSEGLAVYFRDTTERKHAEEILRQSEERSRLALDAGQMGAWEWDMQSNVQYWDASQYQLFGINPDEVTLNQDTFFNRVHPDDLLKLKRSLTTLLEQGGSFDIEFRILRPDGTTRWLAGKGRLLQGYDGQPLRMIGVNFDITERKQAEEERNRLLQAEQAARADAEAANRIKDEFLATLSHELRSPLNAMLGWLTLLRTRELDAETTTRALETVERNARMQTQLVEDLLDVSRIIRGQLQLKIMPISLDAVIESALDTVRPAADAKNIRLQSSIDSTLGSIYGDGNRLQQVIWNLLTNAIKFTPKGGRVEVRLELVEAEEDGDGGDGGDRGDRGGLLTSPPSPPSPPSLSLLPSSRYAQITVSDTGKGIGAEFLPYVFERFRQADNSITRSYGGLGLGLAIVRHLVELHGGTVYASSTGEGKGATFTVRLPIKTNRPNSNQKYQSSVRPPQEPSLDTHAPLKDLTIVVVDDEADARELLVQILQASGAKVVAFANAGDVLAALKNSTSTDRFDVLISDIGMPKEDGYTLLRSIRDLPPEQGGQLPAVALTAYARSEDRQAAYKAGFQAHLAKPFDPAELVNAIANLVLCK